MWLGEIRHLTEQLLEVYQGITDPIELEMADSQLRIYLAELGEEETKRLDRIAWAREHLLKTAEMYEERIKALKAFKATAMNAANALEREAVTYMEAANEKSVATDHFKFTLKDTGGSVVVQCPVEELPAEYQRVKIEPDKVELRKALQAGIPVEGVTLVKGKALVIR